MDKQSLTVVENKLIPVYRTEKGNYVVDVRELHEFLNVSRDFPTWINSRIREYSFIEGVDFSTFLGKSCYGRPPKEYICTLDMGKELGMVERNQEGRRIRKYFIEIEKKTRKLFAKIPKNYPEALRALADVEEENERLRPKAEQHDLFLSGQNAQSISQVAKSFGWGRNRLFAYLREKKILMIGGSEHNLPYQQYIDRDYFHIKESQVAIGDRIENKTTTLVTAKGIEYIGKMLKHEGLIEELRSGA